jgi:UDP-2,4-diacetamido-2,4,6-trideoxy-beta-L-altropyranose hydrolase
MKIAFRVDASSQMGSGHLMRCRTLALALRDCGHEVSFICRAHQGHLIWLLIEDGFQVSKLDASSQPSALDTWLGVTVGQDAEETKRSLNGWRPDWLIVDHYGLTFDWERSLRPHVGRLMVFDDLANRNHECDVLLDQNLTDDRSQTYAALLPQHCRCLLGPCYALVRPEFAQHRAESVRRRIHPELSNLLVFMGGSDPDDETSKVLDGICGSHQRWLQIDVVVGASYPSMAKLSARAVGWPQLRLHVQTPHMADLMAAADLAITAGGTASWEKCVVGLPSLVAIIGDNQRAGALALHKCGAQITLGDAHLLTPSSYSSALDSIKPESLRKMSSNAALVCDGRGTEKIISFLERH